MATYSEKYLLETREILSELKHSVIECMVDRLVDIRSRNGRLFILGVGGSAANASHAVNDFRKIAGMECYTPTDNVSELTARVNDEGWVATFSGWLRISKLCANDGIFIMSVGGGDTERNISPNIVEALKLGQTVGASILGVVARDGGYTATVADVCVLVPTINTENVTPHAEEFQAIIWHLLVSHPKLKLHGTKWEVLI